MRGSLSQDPVQCATGLVELLGSRLSLLVVAKRNCWMTPMRAPMLSRIAARVGAPCVLSPQTAASDSAFCSTYSRPSVVRAKSVPLPSPVASIRPSSTSCANVG